MARMYSRKHGKSGSKRPDREKIPEWVRYGKEEVENIVLKLGKEGKSPPKIGRELRDKYGIPSTKEITGKKISEILEENELRPKIPTDLKNLIKKSIKVKEHLETHPSDSFSIHGLELIESKIRRLAKYYKESDKLPEDWKYSSEKARSLLKE